MERDVATGGNNVVAMAKVPAVGNTDDATAAAEFEVVPARPMAGSVVPMGAMFGLLALPHVDAIVAIVMSVAMVALVAGIVIAIWLEIRKDVVFLEPIEVPFDLARRGYSPAVAAARLLDEARAIQRHSTGASSRRPLGNITALADLQLPGGKLSVRAIVKFARAMIGRPATSIGGEIIRHTGGYGIRLRLRGMVIDPVGGTREVAATAEDVLRHGALDLLQVVDPVTLSEYFITDGPPGDESESLARRVLQQVIRDGKAPQRARALGQLGVIETNKGDTDAAQRLYAESLAAHRRVASPVVLANYVIGFVLAGRDSDAQSAVEEVEARRPRDASNLAAAALAYTVLGLFDRALAAADAAITLKRRLPVAHHRRGLALLYLHRPAEAAQALQRADALDPENRSIVGSLIVALAQAGRVEEAITRAREALLRTPNSSMANMGLGHAELASGNAEGAIAAFARANELFSTDERCKVGFGNALMVAGRHADALLRYEEGIHENPRWGPAWRGAGEAVLKLGRAGDAIEKLERAAALDAHDPQTVRAWADALDLLGRGDEAATKRQLADEIAQRNASYAR
jgi:tetratricopeptide (TPR) repeat protein